MDSFGLEKRWAAYDSHSLNDIIRDNFHEGDLRYLRGHVIEIIEITNEHWALGRCRGRLGVFPLEQTERGPFVLALESYNARTDREFSFVKGNVMPATSGRDPSLYTIFHKMLHGECSRAQLTTVDRQSSMVERINDPHKYYQYSTLGAGQIRLICITTANVEQFLACDKQSLFVTINHVPLDEVRNATALSYCWGDPSDKTPIFANGRLLYIPSTLWRAIRWQYPHQGLRAFSIADSDEKDPQRPALFWADAICINQEDTLEKSHQIGLMDGIYGQAEEVLLYVNESYECLGAMLNMKVIAQAAEEYDPWTIVPHDVIRKKLSRTAWDSVRDFISEQVFRRSWIIQEIVLATNITICYGTARMKLDQILNCINAIRMNHIRHVDSILGFPMWNREQSQQFRDGTKQLLNLASVKSRRRAGIAVNFLEILQSFRQSKATDPRDKVYSLLSLGSDAYREKLTPDYSISNTVAIVYQDLARQAIQMGDLELLLLNAGISQKVTGMPSWVPDWSYETRSVLISDEYACCGPETGSCALLSHENSDRLMVRGMLFDRITRKSPRMDWRQHGTMPDTFGTLSTALFLVYHILSAGSKAVEPLGGLYPNGADLLTAVWHTLILGLGWNSKRAKHIDKNHFYAFLECYQEQLMGLLASNGQSVPVSMGTTIARNQLELQALDWRARQTTSTRILMNEEIPALTPEAEQRAQLEDEMYPFLASMLHYQDERRTCITEKGYFGTVPGEAEEEDLIVIFFGLRIPFVLRSSLEGTYKLIGPCYVYGIMDGEAFTTESDGNGVQGMGSVDFTLI